MLSPHFCQVFSSYDAYNAVLVVAAFIDIDT